MIWIAMRGCGRTGAMHAAPLAAQPSARHRRIPDGPGGRTDHPRPKPRGHVAGDGLGRRGGASHGSVTVGIRGLTGLF